MKVVVFFYLGWDELHALRGAGTDVAVNQLSEPTEATFWGRRRMFCCYDKRTDSAGARRLNFMLLCILTLWEWMGCQFFAPTILVFERGRIEMEWNGMMRNSEILSVGGVGGAVLLMTLCFLQSKAVHVGVLPETLGRGSTTHWYERGSGHEPSLGAEKELFRSMDMLLRTTSMGGRFCIIDSTACSGQLTSSILLTATIKHVNS